MGLTHLHCPWPAVEVGRTIFAELSVAIRVACSGENCLNLVERTRCGIAWKGRRSVWIVRMPDRGEIVKELYVN